MSLTAAVAFATALTTAPAVTIKPVRTATGTYAVALAAAPVGSRVAVSLENGTVRIVDARTGASIREMNRHEQPAYGLAWSADGNFLATGDESGLVQLEDVRTGKVVKRYRTHTRAVTDVTLNIDRTLLVSTSKDNSIKVYDLAKPGGKEIRSIDGNELNLMSGVFNPREPRAILCGIEQGGRIYDAKTGKVTGFMTGHENQGLVDIQFNRNGTRAVTTGRDNTAILWDTSKPTPKKMGSFKGHQDWVMNAAFSPNGRLVATSSTDGTVRIYDTFTFRPVALLEEQMPVGSPVTFTADGKSLLTVNSEGFLTYNAVSPAQPAVEKPAKPTRAVRKPSRRRG